MINKSEICGQCGNTECGFPEYDANCEICDKECECGSCELLPNKTGEDTCPQGSPCELCGRDTPVRTCAAWNSDAGFTRYNLE